MVGGSKRIPILEISKYYSDRGSFVEELRQVCHKVGFFIIKIDFGDLAEQMIQETRSFFQRPLHDKLSISYENSPSFRGYMALGLENTEGKLDHREQIEYAVEYNNNNNNNNDIMDQSSFPL